VLFIFKALEQVKEENKEIWRTVVHLKTAAKTGGGGSDGGIWGKENSTAAVSLTVTSDT